jgi:ATP-dependent exoDNAse (exonuclease V) alpha subunit
VVGLAPSATAAVLGGDLGIAAENTAKWLADHDRRGVAFRAGQLVIVDEASLADTFTVDRIAGLAVEAGAKLLLVGDWAQLQAVEAGGAFSLLAADRDDAPELFDIHRFRHDWEKAASLGLRHGHVEAIDVYQAHGRVHDGDTETMHDAAYTAWLHDLAAGLSSVLVADDRRTVAALNARAREDRIQAGVVDPGRGVALAEGTSASVGDLVITRHNDRRLIAGKTGRVRNGDGWTVTAIHADGSVEVRRAGPIRPTPAEPLARDRADRRRLPRHARHRQRPTPRERARRPCPARRPRPRPPSNRRSAGPIAAVCSPSGRSSAEG